jgi:hypothetical protein
VLQNCVATREILFQEFLNNSLSFYKNFVRSGSVGLASLVNTKKEGFTIFDGFINRIKSCSSEFHEWNFWF